MLSKKRHYYRNMGVFQKLLRIIIYSALDCMPSLGMITINAFACADKYLNPGTGGISASERSGTAY